MDSRLSAMLDGLAQRKDVNALNSLVPTFVGPLWSNKQRNGSSLHEIPYRACFKSDLPAFFIDALTEPMDRVCDPFMGRGTTLVEAALRGRIPVGCDANPLCTHLVTPRTHRLPTLSQVIDRTVQYDLSRGGNYDEDLLAFYHPQTLREITALRDHMIWKALSGYGDHVDRWISMVVASRLTGHSPGFLSVYTMPPNMQVSVERQRKLNEKHQRTPPYRSLIGTIIKKTELFLRRVSPRERANIRCVEDKQQIITASADRMYYVRDESIDLIVTSPPFLDVVDYHQTNWLREWWYGIPDEEEKYPVAHTNDMDEWCMFMKQSMAEMKRILKPGGVIAIEAGDTRYGNLDEKIVEIAQGLTMDIHAILIQMADMSKISHTWGVENGEKGTLTNRVVILTKED